jgi:hypothetical protein
MIRFTFVVGGGKLVRSRYDEDLTRWLCVSLREIGYSEDKSAAETFDSQGTFKQQHDTGQNLKYLIVYPFVSCANRKADSVTPVEAVDTSSNEYVIAASSLVTFKELVAAKTQSWREKKRILKVLQDAVESYAEVEKKLIAGSALTATEQAVYDAQSADNTDKIAWLQHEIKTMADGGALTASERQELVDTLKGSIASTEEEASKARAEGQAKALEKLQAKKQALLDRKALIEKAPVIVHRLKHGDEIRRLRLRLLPLLALEDKGRSMSLTLADLKTLEQKGELEDAIAALERASRGWYMKDDEFGAMCVLETEEAARKYKDQVKAQKAKAGTKPQSKGTPLGGTVWSTVGGGAKKTTGPIKTASRTTTSYASAFGDDSD